MLYWIILLYRNLGVDLGKYVSSRYRSEEPYSVTYFFKNNIREPKLYADEIAGRSSILYSL